MISYQPALDRFHTVFRMLSIVTHIASCLPVELEKIRILDFYVAFPFRLESFTFKQAHVSLKKVGKSYRSMQPYGGIPDDTSLFLSMAPVQALAIDTLAAHGLIDPDAHKKGVILAGESSSPDVLLESVSVFIRENLELFDVLRTLTCEYAFLGEGGIKRRSGLMEHKYDAA